jgi:PadR family transcriptional regulator, regulatory protein PadR
MPSTQPLPPGTLFRMEPGETRSSLSQLRRGALEYCVLALLRGGARYGFDLVRALSEVDGLVTSEGTIYPLLTRLRRDQLVTTFWRESEAGPPRRYYRLTDAGARALADFTHDWARFRDAVDTLLTRGESDDHRAQ